MKQYYNIHLKNKEKLYKKIDVYFRNKLVFWFCPICGFTDGRLKGFATKQCMYCYNGIYEKITGKIFFNDLTGYYECK